MTMAPKLPERYEIHVRLGRDGDVEDWLATDSALDRPVLVRVLAPGATQDRKHSFVESVRAAARAHHTHLSEVYEVGEEPSPYCVLEWHGGVSVADRLGAGELLPVDEFLPNAAGLSEAVAALHAAGTAHGAIDTAAIGFAPGNNAKLTGFGRPRRGINDTTALAIALRTALTGSSEPQVRPSQVAEGLPPQVDDILDRAEQGELDASGLLGALRAVPAPRPVARTEGWSWGWLVPTGALVVIALIVSAAGAAVDVDPDSPFLYPAVPPAPTSPPPATTTTTPPATVAPPSGRLVAVAAVHDPFGENTEHDADLPNVLDSDPNTTWRTERYFSPLRSLKPGVGATFVVDADPAFIEIRASSGTRFEVHWAPALPAEFSGWTATGSGTVLDGQSLMQLPERPGGVWLLWFTDLPEQAAGEYYTEVSLVAFLAG